MLRMAVLAILLLLLAGCTGGAALIAGGANLISLVHTDKTLSDHVISTATGKECSTLNVIETQQPYCQDYKDPEAEAMAVQQTAPYCYQTLGTISCYDRPDPFQNNEDPLR